MRELLDYDPGTGVLRWRRAPRRGIAPGSVAGSVSRSDGYRYIMIDCRRTGAHRIAYLLMTGKWPPAQLDHADMDRDNNRWSNLRPASHAENKQNTRVARRGSRVPLLGVTPYCRDPTRFVAQITVAGKSRYLGIHPTPEAAHAAYVAAKRELHPYGTI